MFLARLRAAEVLQVKLCDLDGAVPHLTRELEHLTAALQVILGEGVTERVSRDAHPFQAAFPLHIFQYRLDAAILESFAGATDEDRRFRLIGRPTVLVDVLPE